MEQDALWDLIQAEVPHSFEGAGPRLRWLVRQLPVGAKVLNIGVGDGGFEQFALHRGLSPCSLDPSQRTIARLHERWGGRVAAKVGRAEAIPWDSSSVDAVVMTEVLEHLDDEILIGTLREVRRVLVSGGLFLGTVPANEDLSLSTVVCPGCANAFHRWGHVRSFSENYLRQMLASDFVNVRVEDRMFTPWSDLAPSALLSGVRMNDPVHAQGLKSWIRGNWRGLLSSPPRLLARRFGARFTSNLAFRANPKPIASPSA